MAAMRAYIVWLLLALSAVVARSAAPYSASSITVIPAATGEQMVRTSLPLPRGFLLEGHSCVVTDGRHKITTAVRPLSWFPPTNGEPKSVRRALVSFAWTFPTTDPLKFSLQSVASGKAAGRTMPVTATLQGESITLNWRTGDRVNVQLLAPSRASSESPRLEVVEDNAVYLWQRWHYSDPQWPRIIELRCDILGGVVLVAHLQRNFSENGRAPDFGWEARSRTASVGGTSSNKPVILKGEPFRHHFTAGATARFGLVNNGLAFYHPAAPLKRRGSIDMTFPEVGLLNYRYLRCTASDNVPMQPTSWQRAEMVIAPSHLAQLLPTLEAPHSVVVPTAWWQELYGIESEPTGVLTDDLKAMVLYHRNAIVRSMAVGDDWGNVTSYADTAAHGGAFGMNRLNHCAAIFEEGWRSGDRRLLETGLLWCDNFYDQSIWWGEKERGGTRYNNLTGMNQKPPDNKYMWRSNGSVNFCTKGYDAFWLAWEQTGDPRMREALDAQVAYAAQHLHADRGECRNIGDARDFIRLYRYTGERRYLDEALRLFRELRTRLSTGDLFDQGGKPIDPDPPFIDDDQRGLTVGFAKPYIIGYALAGLPELSAIAPAEPKLRDVVRSVAHFLAESQDPIGGWRYPHPRTSSIIMSQALEHAWQITQAALLLGPDERLLDAIEATLRQRIQGWRRTGKVFSGLEGWEITTGNIKDRKELYDRYKKPGDRDSGRDYSEGRPSFGSAPPEGIVYFSEVLHYYLRHRAAARLLKDAKPDNALGRVLLRVPATPP